MFVDKLRFLLVFLCFLCFFAPLVNIYPHHFSSFLFLYMTVKMWGYPQKSRMKAIFLTKIIVVD